MIYQYFCLHSLTRDPFIISIDKNRHGVASIFNPFLMHRYVRSRGQKFGCERQIQLFVGSLTETKNVCVGCQSSWSSTCSGEDNWTVQVCRSPSSPGFCLFGQEGEL